MRHPFILKQIVRVSSPIDVRMVSYIWIASSATQVTGAHGLNTSIVFDFGVHLMSFLHRRVPALAAKKAAWC